LLAGQIDIVLFLTGVGTRLLARELETRLSREQLVAALSQTAVVARGPKPVAALRELGVPVNLRVPEPNTWREVLATLDAERAAFPLTGRTVAVQEYGIVNPHLYDGLRERGARVIRVPIYRWALPEDVEPLRLAVRDIVAGQHDVALFTTGTQVWHLFQIAAAINLEDPLRHGLQRMIVASIGPTCSESLDAFQVPADLEPEHPRMGQLVKAAAAQSGTLLAVKS
jgi:uroporphyrinogen-III synthase